MKVPFKIPVVIAFFSLVFLASCTATSYQNYPDSKVEKTGNNSSLNNKRLEKNIDKYAAELNLSKSQVRKLRQTDRRYTRKERRLKSKGMARRKEIRNLQEEKRDVMLAVLTDRQQQKLQELTKNRKFTFFGLMGDKE